MTILESLREKRKEEENDIGGSYDIHELFNIIDQYDLALENALLKLKNRGVEIKDLKFRLKGLEEIAKKNDFDNNFGELDSPDLEEIAQQIIEGYTEGKLNNGESKNIYWDLRVNVWKD